MSGTPKHVENAKKQTMQKKIPVPLCPRWEEFHERHDDGVEIFRNVFSTKLTIGRNVTEYTYPILDLYFDTRSKHPKKLQLLESIREQLKEQLSKESTVRSRAKEYEEMLFTIAVIKEMAADPTCSFHVSRIVEETREKMEGEKDPSWEWITVHTEEEERTDVAAARSGATDPAERC